MIFDDHISLHNLCQRYRIGTKKVSGILKQCLWRPDELCSISDLKLSNIQEHNKNLNPDDDESIRNFNELVQQEFNVDVYSN